MGCPQVKTTKRKTKMVLTSLFSEYGFVENTDFIVLNELSEKNEGSRLVKRSIINHALKMDMAKVGYS